MSLSDAVYEPSATPGYATPIGTNQGTLTFIGNATVVLRYAGFTVLTDPNFLHQGDRIHMMHGLLHSTRVKDPALEISQLPPCDFIVLSHLHEDHWDPIDQRELDKGILILTPPQAAEALHHQGFTRAEGLRTWQTRTIEKESGAVRVTALPARHGPAIVAALMPQAMGSMLDFLPQRGAHLRVYISGDTLPYAALREIPRRFPDIDLALLHLGGTRVLGIYVTMTGAQGVEAMEMIQPRHVIPIHFDDYAFFQSPLSDFRRHVVEAGLEDCVTYVPRGGTTRFTALRGE